MRAGADYSYKRTGPDSHLPLVLWSYVNFVVVAGNRLPASGLICEFVEEPLSQGINPLARCNDTWDCAVEVVKIHAGINQCHRSGPLCIESLKGAL